MKEPPLSVRIRAVAMVFLGVAALVSKPWYHGPLRPLVWSYLGNISASYAVYFVATLTTWHLPRPRLVAGIAALAVVESFELLDGFGITANIYDPWDLLANAVGVGAAWAVAALADRRSTARTA
jgi:hypothetical protein